MNNYMLILRDDKVRFDTFPPDKLKAVLDKFTNWNQSLRERQRFVGAGKLTTDLGRTVRHRDDGVIIDGPFSEAKEAIAGFYVVQAEGMDAAAEIAGECPILTYGGSVEVREVSYLAPQ